MCEKCINKSQIYLRRSGALSFEDKEVFFVKNLYGENYATVEKRTKTLPKGKKFFHIVVKKMKYGSRGNILIHENIPAMNITCDIHDDWKLLVSQRLPGTKLYNLN